MNGNAFGQVARNLRTATQNARQAVTNPADLDELLVFLEEVVKVVHYSFDHVQAVLHKCERLTGKTLTPARAGKLKAEIDELLHRTWWHARGVCAELKALHRQYDPTTAPPPPGQPPAPTGPPLRPVIDRISHGDDWKPILELIQYHEGAVADMVATELQEIGDALYQVMSEPVDRDAAAKKVSRLAHDRIGQTRTAMDQLQALLVDIRRATGRLDVAGPRRAVAPDGLTGPELAALRDALASAFKVSDFEQMLRTRMDVELDLWAGPGTRPEVIYQVILKAERAGRVAELIRAAGAENPGNPELQAFLKDHPHLVGKPPRARKPRG